MPPGWHLSRSHQPSPSDQDAAESSPGTSFAPHIGSGLTNLPLHKSRASSRAPGVGNPAPQPPGEGSGAASPAARPSLLSPRGQSIQCVSVQRNPAPPEQAALPGAGRKGRVVDTTVQPLSGAAGSSAVTGKGAASEMSPVPDGSKDTHLLSLPWS